MRMLEQWNRLNVDEQRLFATLAAFRGFVNMGLPLIRVYFGELRRFKSFRLLPKESLPRLLEHGVLCGWISRRKDFPDTEMMQYNPVFYPFLRQQYAQLLNAREHEQVEKAYIRYYDWMGNNLYRMLADSDAAEHASGLVMVSLEYANLRHALQLSLKQQMDFTFILLPLNAWLEAKGNHVLWREIVASMLSHLEAVPLSKRNFEIWHGLTHLYDTMGAACLRMRAFDEAERWFRRAIETYFEGKQETVYPEAFGGLSQNLAATLAYKEKWIECEAVYAQMLQIAEQYEHLETIANYYLNYGLCNIQQGKHADAVPLLKIAVEKNEAREDVYSVGLSNVHLGSAYAALSEFEPALDCFEIAMNCFEELEDTHGQAEVWDAIVNLFLRQRNFEAVKSAAKKSLEWHILHGKDFHLALIFQALGVASIGLAEWEEGQDYLAKSAQLFKQMGDEEAVQRILSMAREVDKKNGADMVTFILDKI